MLTQLTSLIGLTPKAAATGDQSQKTSRLDFSDVFANIADDGDQAKADESSVDVVIEVEDVPEETSEEVEPKVDETKGTKSRPADDSANPAGDSANDDSANVDELEVFADVRDTSDRSVFDIERTVVASATSNTSTDTDQPEMATSGIMPENNLSTKQDIWPPFVRVPDETRVQTTKDPAPSSPPDRQMTLDSFPKPISQGRETAPFRAKTEDIVPKPVFASASTSAPVASETASIATRFPNTEHKKETLVITPTPAALDAPSRGEMAISLNIAPDADPTFTPSQTAEIIIESKTLNTDKLQRYPELQMDPTAMSGLAVGQHTDESKPVKADTGRLERLTNQSLGLPLERSTLDTTAKDARAEAIQTPALALRIAEPAKAVSNEINTNTSTHVSADTKMGPKPVNVDDIDASQYSFTLPKDNQTEPPRSDSSPVLIKPSHMGQRQFTIPEPKPSRPLTENVAMVPDPVKHSSFVMEANDGVAEMPVSIRRVPPVTDRPAGATIDPLLQVEADNVELERLPQAERTPAIERNIPPNSHGQLNLTKEAAPTDNRIERSVRDVSEPGPPITPATLSKAAYEIPENRVQKLQRPGLSNPLSSVNYPFLAVGDDEVEAVEVVLQTGSGEIRGLQSGTTLPNPIAQVRPDPALIMRQVQDGIQKLSEAGGVELRLSPEELGSVRMQFVQGESGLTVHINAERPETLDLIRRHIDQLAKDLADSGFGSAGFSFGDENPKEQSNAGPRDSEATPQETIPPNNRVTNGLDGVDIRV